MPETGQSIYDKYVKGLGDEELRLLVDAMQEDVDEMERRELDERMSKFRKPYEDFLAAPKWKQTLILLKWGIPSMIFGFIGMIFTPIGMIFGGSFSIMGGFTILGCYLWVAQLVLGFFGIDGIEALRDLVDKLPKE